MSITGFTSTLSTTLRWALSETGDLSTTTDSQTLSHSSGKTFGTGSSQANLVWHTTLSAGATLALGAMPRSVFGVSGTFNFSTAKTLRIKNAQDTGSITVAAATFGLSSAVTLAPGAVLLLDSPSGWSVSGNLVIGGTVSAVEVVVIGVGTVTP